MKLSEYLTRELKDSRFISITGGGGKSSLLKLLGSCNKDKRILLTTTTKFQSPEYFDWGCDRYLSDNEEIKSLEVSQPGTILFANKCEENDKKWKTPDLLLLQKISNKFDMSFAEADGSRHLPLKVHTHRDPVVPEFSNCSIAVMGIWALGNSINENVFGYCQEGVVNQDFLNWYINTPEGLLKGNVTIVVVNGAENASEEQLNMIRKAEWPTDIRVVAASVENDEIVEIVR